MKKKYLTTFQRHLKNSNDLVTTYEAIRAGFVSLALEKNRRATPYVAEARALKEAVKVAIIPNDLLKIKNIESGLLTAAGLSEKALSHLLPIHKKKAINELIKNFLEPAGAKFIEELIFRFLLTKGDALGGSMRNVGGALAQRKLTSSLIATLKIGGVEYYWLSSTSKKWNKISDNVEIEYSLRGLSWTNKNVNRTLLYNLTVPIVKNNIDLSLLNLSHSKITANELALPKNYVALGELKGGIDPAGADEHWKTARTAIARIRESFSHLGFSPQTFFIGAAIEKKMASEIWNQLEKGIINNAANLNDDSQLASISRWLLSL